MPSPYASRQCSRGWSSGIHHHRSGAMTRPPNGARSRTGIKSSVVGSDVEKLIGSWARSFRAGALTVEEVQQRFAALDVNGPELAQDVRLRIAEAQQELDVMRWGVCEVGQRAEIGRVFSELERFFDLHHAK